MWTLQRPPESKVTEHKPRTLTFVCIIRLYLLHWPPNDPLRLWSKSLSDAGVHCHSLAMHFSQTLNDNFKAKLCHACARCPSCLANHVTIFFELGRCLQPFQQCCCEECLVLVIFLQCGGPKTHLCFFISSCLLVWLNPFEQLAASRPARLEGL